MNKFTADEAFDLQGTSEAIKIEFAAADRMCRNHGSDIFEYHADKFMSGAPELYDAADLLGWLGY